MKEQLFNENIKRICRNDKEGLRQIYEDYCPMVYSAVWEVLCNRQDAEDVTSEFFIRLWDIHTGRERDIGPGCLPLPIIWLLII